MTLHGAGQWLNKDRGTIRKIIADTGLVPARIGKYEYFRLSDIVEAMLEGDRLDLQQERAKLAKKQSEKIQLQLDEMNGALIRADDVREEWTKYIMACRAKLLALPSKMTSSVFGVETVAEIHGLLKAQVYEALRELADRGE